MTTLREEDDLFGASLSADFYSSSRPWQRTAPAPAPAAAAARRLDPYDLLDEVRDAPARGGPVGGGGPRGTPFGPDEAPGAQGDPVGGGNPFEEAPLPRPPTPAASRYPLDDGPDLDYTAAETFSVPSKIHAPASPGWEVESQPTFEVDSRASSKYSSVDQEQWPKPQYPCGQESELALAESRSDSEVSEYVPMHAECARQESEDIVAEEEPLQDVAGGDGASERGASVEGEGGASISSFDRLYDDADAMDLEGSAEAAPGAPVPKTPAAVSPRSEAGAEETPEEDPRWARVRSPGFTPEEEAGTPAGTDTCSEGIVEATPEEDPKWAGVKVDVPAAAPPRSHLRGPSSPYERYDAMSDGSSSDETLDGNPFALLASPGTTTGTPAYSYGSGLAGESPMEASDDRLFAPSPGGWAPGTPAAYSFGSGIAGTPDSHGSPAASGESDDSAIGALRSLQPDGGRGIAPSDGPFDEPVSPTEGSADSPPPSPPVRHPHFVSGPFHNAKVKREDPPAEDLGYNPPNERAPEPEGYRHRELFPDIDLATGQPPASASASVQEEAARVLAAADAFIGTPVGADDEAMPAADERYGALDEWTVDEADGYSDVGPRRRSFELDDCYESMYGGDQVTPGGEGMDLECPDTGDRAVEDRCERERGGAREAGGLKVENGRSVQETPRPAAAAANEDMDAESTSDASTSLEGADPSDVSVLSDATGLRGAAAEPLERGANGEALRRAKATLARYDVKREDSMEGDAHIEFGEGATTAALEGQRPVPKAAPYGGVKDGDSMEDMGVRFEGRSRDTAMADGSDDAMEEDDKGRRKSPMSGNTVASPPEIRRRPFRFAAGAASEDGATDDSSTTSASVPSEAASDSLEEDGDDSTDDESEASDDPTIFPSKATSQMNLGRRLARAASNGEADASEEDLAERACRHLARGRNDEALAALTEALARARERVAAAKRRADDFHSHKGRRAHDDELEERLDSDLRAAASEMAAILNNLGVVHELRGDPPRALSAFRDALDAYRALCRRYENAGDAEVDRTVGNLLQMGMALRSRGKREGLHAAAEGLAEEARRCRSSDAGRRARVRTERLHVLGGALDLEAESLGREHPEVGYTLLKRGELHLEMRHYDLAIKDTRDACEIFRKSLGRIHPDTGLALWPVRLADLYNHEVGPGYEGDSDNRATALTLYQEAVRPLRESFGGASPHLGLVHNSIGIIRAAQGDLRRAKASFYEALASYGVRSKDSEPASTGRSCPDVFYVWINVGGLHRDKGQWQLALRSWLKAQSSFLSLDEESRVYLQQIGPRRLMPHALASTSGGSWAFEDNDALLAALLQDIGTAHSMLHQYGKAVEALEEALRLHQVVAMRTGDARHVARLLENLGEVHMTRGDLTSAFERYIASLDLLRRYHGEASVEVALVFGAIGRVHLKKGEYAEARVILKQSMRTFEAMGVPPSNRRVNEIRSCLVDSELALMQTATSTLAGQRRELSSAAYEDKALTIDELADACRNRGDLSEALWFYSEALDIRRRRVEQLSGGRQAGEIVDVGRTVSNIAQLRCERREFGAAKILFDEAKQLYNDAGLATDHPFFRDLHQEIDLMRKM